MIFPLIQLLEQEDVNPYIETISFIIELSASFNNNTLIDENNTDTYSSENLKFRNKEII
jgi:hypothetical protein